VKQEHRFVADPYRYLAPFIDTRRELFISLDGIAARRGVAGGHFTDPDVPDLWFYFVGSCKATLLEAKILGEDNKVLLGQAQLAAWRTGGPGADKPTAWVVTNEELSTFYYWSHDDFCHDRLDGSNSTQDYVPFRAPDTRASFSDIRELALHILGKA
jgi:hypothetical protein